MSDYNNDFEVVIIALIVFFTLVAVSLIMWLGLS